MTNTNTNTTENLTASQLLDQIIKQIGVSKALSCCAVRSQSAPSSCSSVSLRFNRRAKSALI